MSSDEQSTSSSSDDEADLSTTGLIATRAKRSTAGNLYETLRANLDDEELQKELLAEDEDDQGEYEGSDRDEDDVALDSSSDDEDAGPLKEGEAEDLEGEKELKKQERNANKKKRKMEEAKMRLPAWQKKKKVKLADDVKSQDGATAKPKKKSERSNWLPTDADLPVRQSTRASAIANREVVHTNLKESALRSEKQKKVMAQHAVKLQTKRRADLSQEQRIEKAAKIERETAREFGRWEREEAERQRIREELLAAKRKRGIDGPVIRHWSGSVLWEGDKIKRDRLHGSVNVEELEDELEEEMKSDVKDEATSNIQAADQDGGASISKSASILDASLPPSNMAASPQPISAPPHQDIPAVPPKISPTTQPESWLDGIQEYAAQRQEQLSPMPLRPNPYTPSAPGINGTPLQPPPHSPIVVPGPSTPSSSTQPAINQLHSSQIYHGWPPSYQNSSIPNVQPQPVTAPPVPPPQPSPPPLIKEQAQRSLIMLEQFEKLEAAPISKRGSSKAAKEALLEPSPLASTLLPMSYPTFSQEEGRYLTAKMKKISGVLNIPAAPPKTKCALTSWPAKFRDPKTGLPYADMQAYKMIQRILAGGCQWSGLLGAWSGPHYGAMGRAAAGVPDGFGTPAPVSPADGEIKTEAVT